MTFYLPDRGALRGRDVAALDPDRDWDLFGTGLYVWILQTFLRLRAAGAPVDLTESVPASGLVVAHADHAERVLAEASSPSDLVLVCVRADRRPRHVADVEIVQNRSSAGGGAQFFVPSWLQPGLIARNAARGAHLETVAYMGTRGQLHDDLGAAAWGTHSVGLGCIGTSA